MSILRSARATAALTAGLLVTGVLLTGGAPQPALASATLASPAVTTSRPAVCTPLTELTVVMVSWVDFLRWGGRLYTAAAASTPAGSLRESALGRPLGVTGCELSADRFDEHRVPQDGDSAYLPQGSGVFEVRGYPTTARLAVRVGNAVRVFVVRSAP